MIEFIIFWRYNLLNDYIYKKARSTTTPRGVVDLNGIIYKTEGDEIDE